MIHYVLTPFRSGFHGPNPCWIPPANAIGTIDYRSLTNQSISDFMFAALDDSIAPLDAEDIVFASAEKPVHDLSIAVKASDRTKWEDMLGVKLTGGIATLADVLAATFLAGDSEGQTAVKPLLPTGDEFAIHLGGHSKVWSMPLARGEKNDPFIAQALRVHAADIRSVPDAVQRGKLLTDVLTKHGFPTDKRTAKDVLGIDEEPQKRQTSYTDDFNRSGDLNGSTASGGGTWTEVSGTAFATVTTSSGQVECGVSFARNDARLDSDVSSADHYTQMAINTNGSLPSGFWGFGPTCRFSSSAVTYYQGEETDSNLVKQFKYVATAETQIGSSGSYTSVQGDVLKIKINGSTLTLYVNAASQLANTDTSISGGTRGGIFYYNSLSALYGKSWVVDDEAGNRRRRLLFAA